jgi:hypothetical protein
MVNGVPPDGSTIVTADATYWTADETQWPSADGGLLEGVSWVFEPSGTVVTSDTTAYSADNTVWPDASGGVVNTTADFVEGGINVGANFGGLAEPADAEDILDATGDFLAEVVEPADAEDLLDAIVEAATGAEIGGGGPPPEQRPFPVESVGYGILPELEGDARGVVCVAGIGAGTLGELSGAASGTIGAAGNADAQVALRAVAIGQRGICGTATGSLELVVAWAPGAAITHGIGAGAIGKPRGVAMGQHDDDEAAVMAFLLAA